MDSPRSVNGPSYPEPSPEIASAQPESSPPLWNSARRFFDPHLLSKLDFAIQKRCQYVHILLRYMHISLRCMHISFRYMHILFRYMYILIQFNSISISVFFILIQQFMLLFEINAKTKSWLNTKHEIIFHVFYQFIIIYLFIYLFI